MSGVLSVPVHAPAGVQGVSVCAQQGVCPSLPQSTVVRRALGCLAPALPRAAGTHTQALLAYTFALARDSQRAQELLDALHRKAIRAGTGPSVPRGHQRKER